MCMIGHHRTSQDHFGLPKQTLLVFLVWMQLVLCQHQGNCWSFRLQDLEAMWRQKAVRPTMPWEARRLAVSWIARCHTSNLFLKVCRRHTLIPCTLWEDTPWRLTWRLRCHLRWVKRRTVLGNLGSQVWNLREGLQCKITSFANECQRTVCSTACGLTRVPGGRWGGGKVALICPMQLLNNEADTTEQFQMQISSGCAANLSSNVVVFPTPNAHLWRSLRSLSSSSLRPLQWMKTGTPPHRPPQGRFAYAASVYLRSTSKSWSNLVPWEESAPHLPPRANLKDLAQWMTTPPAWKSSNKERALDRFRIWCPPRTTWQHSLQQSLECKKCDLSVQLQILQEIRAAAVLLPVPSNSDTSAPGKCARRCRRCSRPWQHSFVGRSWGNAQTLWAARNKHGGWSSIRCQGRCSECNCFLRHLAPRRSELMQWERNWQCSQQWNEITFFAGPYKTNLDRYEDRIKPW